VTQLDIVDVLWTTITDKCE